MKWEDEGIISFIAPFSDNKIRAGIITLNHGYENGLIYLKKNHHLQLGDKVNVSWNARLQDHLGTFKLEVLFSYAPYFIQKKWKIWLLQNLCHLIQKLPQRHPYANLYPQITSLLDVWLNCSDNFLCFYQWEIFERIFLHELGFGLDISKCCLTGVKEDLDYLSPRTGRAVNKEAAIPYKDKLFLIPSHWKNEHPLNWQDLRQGLTITGHFLQQFIFEKNPLPTIRSVLLNYLFEIENQS